MVEEDWRQEFIDLSSYAGQPDLRVAFVSVNGGGNNLFLDDIQFFLSSNPDPPEVPDENFTIFPNPAKGQFNVAFNLFEKEDLSLVIYDPFGRLITTWDLPNTLNQTYAFDFFNQPNGIYFLRFVGDSFVKTKRVRINQ